MSPQEVEQAMAAQSIDSTLTQLYVSFLNELSREMDAAYAFEDRCEDMDYYRGMLEALSRSAEIFRRKYEDVSKKCLR